MCHFELRERKRAAYKSIGREKWNLRELLKLEGIILVLSQILEENNKGKKDDKEIKDKKTKIR